MYQLRVVLRGVSPLIWRRSIGWALLVLNAMGLANVSWSLAYARDSGWAIVPPAVVGLVVCNAALIGATRRAGYRLSFQSAQGVAARY